MIHYDDMNESKLLHPIRVPLTDGEFADFRAYLKSTGRKAGPWLRVLILQAIEQDKALMSGMSQVDMDFIERAKQAKREGQAQ